MYPSSWPGPLAREQGLAFQYTLPSTGGPATIEKVFPSGAERVVVITQTGGPKVEVAGAREEAPPAPAEPADTTPPPRRLVVDRVPPGGRVTLRIALPETRVDPDAVHLEETRIFLELDDAALQVQEQHMLHVDGKLPVVGKDAAPLLAIPLPEGAVDVRFDRDAFALGLAPDDGVGAVLRGPLPPGASSVQISYHLPLDGGEAIFEKRFGRTLPLLSIYVADTGIHAVSERLHRRRPVKTTDRTYLALEAFQVDPSETVRLALAPLGAPLQLPRFALFAAVALAAGVAVSFLFAPLRGDGSAGNAPAKTAPAANAKQCTRRCAISSTTTRPPSSPTRTTRRCAPSCAHAPRRCCAPSATSPAPGSGTATRAGRARVRRVRRARAIRRSLLRPLRRGAR